MSVSDVPGSAVDGGAWISVPVLKDFDPKQTIGELRIRVSELPPVPDFHIAVGYMLTPEGGYSLMAVSIIPNDVVANLGAPNG